MATTIGKVIRWYQVGNKWHAVNDKLGGFLCRTATSGATKETKLQHPVKPDGGMLCIECLRELNR